MVRCNNKTFHKLIINNNFNKRHQNQIISIKFNHNHNHNYLIIHKLSFQLKIFRTIIYFSNKH